MKRLSKVLAHAGVASRRACEELIFKGRVHVNGKKTLIPQTLVDLATDTILVDNQPISQEEEKVYFLLNKPKGYICSSKRPGSKKIVTDLFINTGKRVFTVGRLDRETTGLLIVTNDGAFAQEVIHPSAQVTKEYLVKTREEIMQEHLIALSAGIYIDGVFVKPVRVNKVRKGTVKICVKEGKKREIRSIVEKAGLEIIELSRIRIGGLHLGPLSVGEYRPMNTKDKDVIFS